VPDPDAIVVGSGPNGLVAANLLADAGWDVLVLEAQPRIGGAVASDSSVHEGYVHDTFSSFYPLAAASPTISGLGLERHGLEWVHAPAVVGHALDEGRWAVLHRDRNDTAASLDALCPGDGDAWLELCRWWGRISEPLIGALLTPFPPVRHGSSLALHAARAGGLDLVRRMLMPVRGLGAELFRGEGPRLLLAGNAAHADIPLDAPGSGLMGVLLTMLGQTVGFPVPEGGSSRLTDALAARFTQRGGEIRCDAPATRLEVDRGRVVAVRTDGTRIVVRRAVVAAVVAPILYERLLRPEDLPARVRRGMRRFQLDPATLKVDWALDSPVPWAQAPPVAPGTVHVADSLAELSEANGQISGGLVPERPFLLVGQMTTADPTRSPAGTEALWAYTHVPQRVKGDAGEDSLTGTWDRDECERFADRMQQRLEDRAPGFTSRIRARRILGPHELEEANPNLLGGAVNGGTSQLHQQLVFRPVPGNGRAETGIGGLYLASASAHPGGGVHGAPGSNAARAALAHDRLHLGRRA
jgi:phytoene dehydrogenase-like protein